MQVEKLKQYDHVILKDGREGAAVEILGADCILVDVGSSPQDWDNIAVAIEDIVSVGYQDKNKKAV